MPLPLLLAPVAVIGAKATVSVGTLIASIVVSGLAGGSIVGLGGLALWYLKLDSKTLTSLEHMKALDEQHQITQTRIRTASEGIQKIDVELTSLSDEIDEVIDTISLEQLQLLSEKIAETSNYLQSTVNLTQKTGEELHKSLLGLKEIGSQIKEAGIKSTRRISMLNQLLDEKEEKLTQATKEIAALNKTATEQTSTLEELQNVIKKLTDENLQKTQIIETQGSQINQLQTICGTLKQQCMFFKAKHMVIEEQPAPTASNMLK
ncbi:hypothetical protein [Legionella septentrionalis]|uniref:hypothetical protein n=1 Tax=Legionella septentrionalis TaxID=2498109 RepID=UPI000F8E11AB|nr:hypothetical protein [Legionella septentrionalis]RUQ93498.1 hypothetical protein ELY11_11830 [Legionella septentrionalis]